MKIIVAFAVLNCLFIINGSYSLAAPTNEDAVTVTSDAKRDAEYRNSLFSVYTCRVKKATDAVLNKLQVTLNSDS